MTSIILFITRIVMILAVPASIVLLILKATEIESISWLVVFLPIIIASMMIALSVVLVWFELTLAKFE